MTTSSNTMMIRKLTIPPPAGGRAARVHRPGSRRTRLARSPPARVRSGRVRTGDYAGSAAGSRGLSSLCHEVADVRARETLACGASHSGSSCSAAARYRGVAKVDPPFPGERRACPCGAGRQHAVEDVDPPRDDLEDALRVADSHEVARALRRQQGRRPPDAVEHLLPCLTHSETTEREPVEREGRISSSDRRLSSSSVPPWEMPNRSWPGARAASTCRSAQTVVSRTARSSSFSDAPAGRQTSRHIAMSEPRRRWISAAPSGVKRASDRRRPSET